MVNIGRPSRGCAVCRRRRIKCDEKEPQCSYCVKTNQHCPGYKDDFTLAWRDQTATARKKVQKRKQKQQESSSDDGQSENSQEKTIVSRRPSPVSGTLSEYLEDHAISFFFDTHAIRRDHEICYGFMEQIPDLFFKTEPGGLLFTAVQTVAMRMFEPWIDTRREYSKSRTLYYSALSKAREQVASEKDCWSDEFLLAILMMDMYEGLQAVTGVKVNTHVSGAAALVRRRPTHTYQSETSKALLLSLRHALTLTSIRTKTPFPSDIFNLVSSIPDLPGTYARILDGLQTHVANLAAASLSHNDPTARTPPTFSSLYPSSLLPTDPYHTLRSLPLTTQMLIDRALGLDTQLVTWSKQAPSFLLPTRVRGAASIPPSVAALSCYADHADLYPNVFTANIWNIYRTARVRLAGVVLDCVARLREPERVEGLGSRVAATVPAATEGQFSGSFFSLSDSAAADRAPGALDKKSLVAFAEKTVQGAADEICASVPYHLGDRTGHQVMPDDRTVRFPVVPGREVPVVQYRSTAGMARWFLIGPFSTLLASRVSLREGQKEWVRGQMERLTRVHGGPRTDGG